MLKVEEGYTVVNGNKFTISNKCHYLFLLSWGACAPNMKLACLQTASLGRYARVSMETRCSWQQADYELLWAQRTYVPNMKLYQKSFKQQSWNVYLCCHGYNIVIPTSYNIYCHYLKAHVYQVWKLNTKVMKASFWKYAGQRIRQGIWKVLSLDIHVNCPFNAYLELNWISSVKMGQESRWVPVIYPLKES